MSCLDTCKEVGRVACEQGRTNIDQQGDCSQCAAGFEGFYLTREHHSRNSSATAQEMKYDGIASFIHHTKSSKLALKI